MTARRPPKAATSLLRKILPVSHAEDVADDLERAYHKRIDSGWSWFRADLWYCGEVIAPDTFRLASLLKARDRTSAEGPGMRNRLESAAQDIRYALRALSRKPLWTFAVACTLALGLAATTAAFSIVYGVMLKPLPFEKPDELMALRRGDRWGWETVSFPVYEDLIRRQQVFEDIGVWSQTTRTMLLDDRPVRMSGAMVSHGLLPALSATPARGRWLAEDDDFENAPGVLILSHSFWTNQFGGDEGIVGRSVVVNDLPHTVVGVMPEGFAFPRPTTMYWVSLAHASRERDRFYLRPVGRLKSGISQEAAQDHIAGTEWVIPPAGDEPERIVPLQAMSLLAYSVRDSSTTLWLFQGAAFAVLLIACLNVTGLVLVRAKTRESEIALRAALGAARSRLARFTLTETGLLGLFGGAIGIVATIGLVRAAMTSIPGGIPLQERIGVGMPVIGTGILLAAVAGVVIGVLPAIRTTRVDLGRGIGNAGKGIPAGKSGARIWNVLVSAQLAVAAILLIGGGLLLESFVKLRNVDPGFDPEHVLVANVPIPRTSYPDQITSMAFYEDLTARLEGLPQIRNATVVAQAPFTGWSDGASEAETETGVVEDVGYTEFQTVGPGYFEAMGVPILSGRDFDARDGVDDAMVAIVNETLANRHFQGRALGRRLRKGRGDESPWLTIVGVVGDIKHISLDAPRSPQVYSPYSRAGDRYGQYRMPVVIRADGDPLLVAGAVREAVAAIDPSVPPPATYSLQSDMERTMTDERFNTWIIGSFAATAMLLAMLGVYSVVAQTVTMRSREFGIKKALGATESRVVFEVVSRSGLVIVFGLSLGLAVAFAMAGVMESLLFGVETRDPFLFVVVAVALGFAAVTATYLPARRAGLLDPVDAIRSE